MFHKDTTWGLPTCSYGEEIRALLDGCSKGLPQVHRHLYDWYRRREAPLVGGGEGGNLAWRWWTNDHRHTPR